VKLFPSEVSIRADEEAFPYWTEDRPQKSLAWQRWHEYYAKALCLSAAYPYQRTHVVSKPEIMNLRRKWLTSDLTFCKTQFSFQMTLFDRLGVVVKY